MHNCKSTRDSLIELALDDMAPVESAQMLAELKDCRNCQEEFATIKSTLRTSGQALQSALPAQDFWPGYHARLQTALAIGLARQHETNSTHAQLSPGARVWLALRSLMTTSVRVPAPVAAALVFLFGVSVFFAARSPGAAAPNSLAATSTESVAAPTRVVEVPVIKEKLVTRIVYVDTSRRRAGNAANFASDARGQSDGGNGGDGEDDDRAPLIDATNGVARVRPDTHGAAMSLAGFKPTDEVKLTIIKGSDPK